MTRKIDLVYLWLDGNDQKWRAEKEKWQAIEEGRSPVIKDNITEARWRDNDELKYSLRSAEMFAPWINHIYIVTCMGQVPSWLDTFNPKITIVDHTEIMPSDALPTFNSIALAHSIINIPNLSEYFLFANDDTFFGRPLTPDYFYSKEGKPVFWYSIHNEIKSYVGGIKESPSEYRSMLLLTNRLFENIFGLNTMKMRPSHNITASRKSTRKELLQNPLIDVYYKKSVNGRFRNLFQISTWIFFLYDFAFDKSVPRRMRYPKPKRHFIYNWIHRKNIADVPYYSASAYNRKLDKIRPALFCVNDSSVSTEKTIGNNKRFFQEYFPDKSSFEK